MGCTDSIDATIIIMRIVSGKFSGLRFNPPANIPARPTTEVAKEGLFNTLRCMIDLEDIKTLDIFAGTGSISYELASNGANNLTLVEQDNTTINFIKKTIKSLDIENNCIIFKSDVFKFLKQCTQQYNFIFAGPPYALTTIDDLPNIVFERNILLPGGFFVLEHTPRNNYENHANFFKTKKYGTTVFSFFTLKNN